ncbi:hypothetical protein [Botrimarina sp.]|uniref:hypothetical protein n=1 Tax=Botrimarina sp. TaxID=2795802 RepID=UPI0032EB3A7C
MTKKRILSWTLASAASAGLMLVATPEADAFRVLRRRPVARRAPMRVYRTPGRAYRRGVLRAPRAGGYYSPYGYGGYGWNGVRVNAPGVGVTVGF